MLIQSTDKLTATRAKILLYGESGTGKTRLAGTFPGKTLIISAESGLLSLKRKAIDFVDLSSDDNGKEVPQTKRIARLGEVYQYLLTEEAKKKYSYIVLDSLSELGECLVAELSEKPEYQKDGRAMWGEYLKRMTTLAKRFRDLPDYGVMITCQAEADKDEMGKRFMGVLLQGQIKKKIPYMFDEVYLLAIAKSETGQKRVLLTAKSDSNECKSRLDLPGLFEDPDMTKIIELIEGKKEEELKKEAPKK